MMIRDKELLEGLICYGRAPVQDFVTRSRNIQDAIQYLQMERGLEMFRLTPFMTKDLICFEKRNTNLWSNDGSISISRGDGYNHTRPSRK